MKYSFVFELSKFSYIGVDSNSYSDSYFDVDFEFDSLGVVPYDLDVTRSECTSHVVGSTYVSYCYVEVQVVEPISPSSLVLDIKPTPNTPELKPLPKNFKYVYLKDQQRLLVIISTSVTVEQEQRLLEVLKKHRKVIG